MCMYGFLLSKLLIDWLICRKLGNKLLIDWLIYRKLGKKKQRFRLWRQKFLSGLNSIGLDVEEVSTHLITMTIKNINTFNHKNNKRHKMKTNKMTISSLGSPTWALMLELGIG